MPEEENVLDNSEPETEDLDGFLGGSDEDKSKPSATSMKTFIIMAMVMVLAAGAGVGVVIFVMAPETQAADSEKIEEQKIAQALREVQQNTKPETPETVDASLLYSVDDLVVNVQGTDMHRYLKADLLLVLRDQKIAEKTESELMQIEIRDRLIKVFSSKSITDLDGVNKQNDLKVEVQAELSSILGSPDAVEQVFFKALLVQ